MIKFYILMTVLLSVSWFGSCEDDKELIRELTEKTKLVEKFSYNMPMYSEITQVGETKDNYQTVLDADGHALGYMDFKSANQYDFKLPLPNGIRYTVGEQWKKADDNTITFESSSFRIGGTMEFTLISDSTIEFKFTEEKKTFEYYYKARIKAISSNN